MPDYVKFTRLSDEAHQRLLYLVELENKRRASASALNSEVSAAAMASHIIMNYQPNSNGAKEEKHEEGLRS